MLAYERLKRLPQYAQREIRRLEANVDHWRAQYEEAVGSRESGSPLGLAGHDYVDGKLVQTWTPLPARQDVTFRFDHEGGHRLDFGVDGQGAPELYGLDGHLLIRPHSANVAKIGLKLWNGEILWK